MDKEMIYEAKCTHELLKAGNCNGFNYYIMSLGTHPTAYVEIPKNHIHYKQNFDEFVDIDVHGGITYSSDCLNIGNITLHGWFIGWDYAHFDDYYGFDELYSREFRTGGKKWTVSEIHAHVVEVCKQLKELNNKKDEIKEGMYAYSKESREKGIGKIIKYDENRTHLEVTIKTRNGKLTTRKEFVISSHNIIDLIEVGDYVNGQYVVQVARDTGWVFTEPTYYDDKSGEERHYCYNNREIEGIVTKEQFSQMEYKAGE